MFIRGHGPETEVSVGPEDGLKHPSWIGCDGLVSIPKSRLTDFVGSLSPEKLSRLSHALRIALDIYGGRKTGEWCGLTTDRIRLPADESTPI